MAAGIPGRGSAVFYDRMGAVPNCARRDVEAVLAQFETRARLGGGLDADAQEDDETTGAGPHSDCRDCDLHLLDLTGFSGGPRYPEFGPDDAAAIMRRRDARAGGRHAAAADQSAMAERAKALLAVLPPPNSPTLVETARETAARLARNAPPALPAPEPTIATLVGADAPAKRGSRATSARDWPPERIRRARRLIALGQTLPEIAATLFCSMSGLKAMIAREGLMAPAPVPRQAERHRRDFTLVEDAVIRAGTAAGLSATEIGIQLGRAGSTVSRRARALGLDQANLDQDGLDRGGAS